MGVLSPDVSPAGTNSVGATTWNSLNGIGQSYSYAGETALRGFVRGGHWTVGGSAGVLSLAFLYPPSSTTA